MQIVASSFSGGAACSGLCQRAAVLGQFLAMQIIANAQCTSEVKLAFMPGRATLEQHGNLPSESYRAWRGRLLCVLPR